MHTAICSSRSIVKDAPQIDNKAFPDTSFWNPGILELVELVLRPPQGGPPSLPEQSDAVFFLFHVFFINLCNPGFLKCIYLMKHLAILSFPFGL